jgi:CP family cyanate transporter-like MFS transporter
MSASPVHGIDAPTARDAVAPPARDAVAPGDAAIRGSEPLPAPSPSAPGRGSITAIAALFVLALALRPQIVAIGPLMPLIREDLQVPFGVAGLLTTIPVLCMGLFAPVGPWLGMRLGPRIALAVCLGITIAFGIARTFAPDAWLVLLLTFGAGIGMGMAGPLLSITVRLRVPGRPGLATGAYAAGFVIGSSLSAILAIPLAGAGASWRQALLLIALSGLVSIVGWLILLPPDTPGEHVINRPRGLPVRRPIAWGLVLAFGLQSIIYFGSQTWLPNIYVERGWDQATAGSLVGILNTTAIIGTFGAPLIADRWGSRRQQLVGVAVLMVAGLLGVIVLPDSGVVWVTLLGMAVGGVFPLVLILPVDVADRPGDIGAVASLMLLGGYIMSSIGPATLGVVRDVTGDFVAVLWALVALSVIFGVAAWRLSPERLRRGLRAAPVASTA